MALPNFNEQTTLLFFFFLQGMIFAGLLYRKGIQEEQVASKWLSVFVFLCCLYLVPWMLGHLNWYALDGYSDFLFFVPFHQLFFLGPVMYMYTRSQLNPSFVFTWRDGWHFVPGALYLLYSLVIFVVDFFVLDEYYFYADGRDKDLAKWYQITGLLALLTYAVLSFQYYRAYRKAINATVSFADGIRFDWMRQFLLAVLLLVFLRAFFLIILPDWGSFGDKWWYYFFFGCVTYFIAFAGYGNTVKSLVPFDAPPFSDEPELT
ncbi:MAG: AraC family transcriptional regulator, partial [Bacteroidota bacterium]